MPPMRRAPDLLDWRAIASLGEQLVSADSLIEQRDRIVRMTGRMVHGRADVWLHESLFRLPHWKQPRAFPPQPRSEVMRRVVASRQAEVRRAAAGPGDKKTVAALPIEDHGVLLGVMQVTRASGPDFSPEDMELLESIAGVVAVGLFASHRVEVERFRQEELNLVRRVSAEIATVMQLDELSRRVCELIQETFNYYYVAIFTLKQGEHQLRFRSSASAPRKGLKGTTLALEVELGQGLIGEAAASGELVSSPDVRADARYRYIEPLPETRSEAVIPLKLNDQVLGVLDVQSDRLDAFHPNDLKLLQALADNIARAAEGARLYGDLRRRADQLLFLADISRSVASTLELGEIMAQTAALIQTRFGFQHVMLFTVHPMRRLIEFEAGSGKRSEALRGYSIPLEDPQGLIPWVARKGETVLTNDVETEPRYRPSPWPPRNTRSELTVPLTFGDKVLGVLDIQSSRTNAFTEDDRTMFETVGGTIAAAIRNADLYRSEQWRRQVADSLREVAGLLSQHVGLDEALQAILTELERNLPVDVATIWLLDRGEMHVAASRGVDPRAIERGMVALRDARGEIERLMQESEPVIRNPSDPLWPSGKAAGFRSDYSSLAAPLRVGDQPVGLITLAHHGRGRYGHEARAMATTFASYAAVAIENARLYDEAQEQAYASAALLQVAQAVASPAEIGETLASIMRILPILLGIERAVLYGWDAVRRVYWPRAEFGLPELAKAGPSAGEFGVGQFRLLDAAAKNGEVMVHALRGRDAPEGWMRLAPTHPSPKVMAGEARLLIAIPLLIKNDRLGVLIVEEGDGPLRFRQRRLEIIQGISQQMAIAIQNDLLQSETVVRERLETEVQLARQIQKEFIPKQLPERDGWDLAARWETARQVGGDFYDVIELPDGNLGLFIADVADKGMPAALFMALTRTLFRAAASETDSPSRVLHRMNELLIPDTAQGMFVTAVYAVLNPATGDLTYANAGHNPPLWIRTSGAVEKLRRTAMALGVLESAAVSEKRIRLAPGEGMLMYTDGLTEAFAPSGELYGEGKLVQTLCDVRLGNAADLIQQVQASLEAFMEGAPLADDLTMLALRHQ